MRASESPDNDPSTPQELELATRLLPHVSTYTVIDRREHALGVARMILAMGARP